MNTAIASNSTDKRQLLNLEPIEDTSHRQAGLPARVKAAKELCDMFEHG
jgi:hypothetical protein